MVDMSATEPTMSPNRQMLPDPSPLREVLRGIRFIVKSSGETLKAGVSHERLPRSAADLANTVIDELMSLGHRVNVTASGLAKTMIGTEPDTDILLDELTERESADALFAATVYGAMKIVLERMNVSGVLVSEAAAKRAFVHERDSRERLSGIALASSLTLRLIDGQFLRSPLPNTGRSVPDDAVVSTAVFAVLLWLQSPRQTQDQQAALMSASDLSIVLSDQIASACGARDRNAIGAMYGKYAANV